MIFCLLNYQASVATSVAEWEERQLREREGPKLAYELLQGARARELRVSEGAPLDLLDPDARTPLLIGHGGWFHQPWTEAPQEIMSHSFWYSHEIWGRLLRVKHPQGTQTHPICGILGSHNVTLVVKDEGEWSMQGMLYSRLTLITQGDVPWFPWFFKSRQVQGNRVLVVSPRSWDTLPAQPSLQVSTIPRMVQESITTRRWN